MSYKHALPLAMLLSLATLAGGQTALPPPSSITGHMDPAARIEVPAGMHAQISSVDVKEGDVVKKNQQLAKLDDSIQQATVELAQVAADTTVLIRAAENQLASAQNQWEKVRGSTAFNETDKRQKELDYKQAQLTVEKEKEDQKQKQIALKKEQITLEHMTIRSPIDGSVLRVNKHAGEETDENPLIVVVDTSKLHAVFDMPRQLFGQVHVGDKATLVTDAGQCEGAVISVDPVIDLASGLFRVKMEVDNRDAKIPAGIDVTWNWKGK